MRFEETDKRRTPPMQGFVRYAYNIVDGPTWEERAWRGNRAVTHGIVKLIAIVYDDGSTEFKTYEKRIKKDGTPYNESPRLTWTRSKDTPETQAHRRAVEQFRQISTGYLDQ